MEQQVTSKNTSSRDDLFRDIFIVSFVCIVLALIGTVLAITGFVSHISYPGWVKVPWAITNFLLTLIVAIVIAGSAVISGGEDDIGGAMIACTVVLTFAGFSIAKDWASVQSLILLVVFVGLLAICTAMFPFEKPTNARVSLSASPGVKPEESGCSVCHQMSQYGVCMDCEREHQREIQRVRSQNWRAKKAGEPATLTIAEWLIILDTFQHHCAYCQMRPYELMEHYIPIGQGKKDGGTTAKNCVPGCRFCNAGKSNRHPEK